MNRTILYCSVSVDGYATGPDGDLSRLHRWLFDFDRNVGTSYSDELTERFREAGAIVFGRRTYDSGQEPWGDEEVFAAPVFVVTHDPMPAVAKNGTVFTFVEGSAERILEVARAAAGDRDVVIMGSPDVAGQFLRAGLVDALHLHLVPVLLGGGTRLFEGGLGASVELKPRSLVRGIETIGLVLEVDRIA